MARFFAPTRLVLAPLLLLWLPILAQNQEPGEEDPQEKPAEPAGPVTVVDPLTGEVTIIRPPEPEGDTAPPRADLTEANELLLAGKLPELEGLLAGLQEDFPEDAAVLLMRGEVLLALQQVDAALTVLQLGAELEPDRPRMQFQLGSALAASGEADEALEAFARELAINEEPQVLLLAHLNRALLLGQKKDWVGSNAELEDVLLLDPEKVEIYGDLAANDMLAEDYVKAAETLERGRAAGFQSASHYYSLGARLCKNKDYEAGAAAFGTALEIDPALARAERSLAACLEGQGQTADAIKHLERYLELAPEAPDAENVAQKIEHLKKS